MRPSLFGKVFVLVATTATAIAPLARAQRPTRTAPSPSSSRAAQPAQTPASNGTATADPSAEVKMHLLLKDWERRSALLKTLDVKITRVDEAWGKKEQYEGRAILKAPNLAWLDFSKVDPADPKKPPVHDERIVCTGKEVWQYKTAQKQVFIFTLDSQNQKRALEEGPLPFLFNMRADAAEARYKMTLIKEASDHWVIGVEPLLQVDQEAFSMAYLKLSRTTYLPDRILLRSPNGKDTKEFFLRKIEPNAAVDDANFVGKPLGKPWTMVRNPGTDGPSAPPAGRPRDLGARPRAASPTPRR